MDVARLNFAHGTVAEKAATADRVRDAAGAAGREVAVLQDLPGPKLRIGALTGGIAELKPGERLTLVCGMSEEGDASRVPVQWDGLAEAIEPDGTIYLADGSVRLRAEAVRAADGEIDTVVEIGGPVSSRQGLNIPGELTQLPAVADDDLERLRFGEQMGVDLVAMSFVRRAQEVTDLRSHTDLPLIAKVEKPQAVENIDAIAEAADCLMVARGDLGIELEIQEVPMVQKRVIAVAGQLARPVITATQLLDSMINSSRPTRAEVTDVANAILDGTDAVMLSQETAVGRYPVETIAMMASIAQRTEEEAPFEVWNEHRVRRLKRSDQDPAYTVAYNACAAARQLDLAALIVPTLSGRSARIVSAHRPRVPIFAFSPDPQAVRRCALMWGVEAAAIRSHQVTEELIADAVSRAVELGWVKEGEHVGVTAGLPSGQPGTTSLFQLQRAAIDKEHRGHRSV